MRLQVKGKNVPVEPSIREYAESKLAALDKQLRQSTAVVVELSEETNPSISDCHVADATIFAEGTTLRAHAVSPNMRASIDRIVGKLERQLRRYNDKRRLEPRRHAPHHGV
ncbi:MAG TPA: ribosome-associated translation inhibitor RaiA [Gaiellaceae bacterium]|nr:ribosome-associated translation inhibitor RaiA [Gaiellaceae bacterium]